MIKITYFSFLVYFLFISCNNAVAESYAHDHVHFHTGFVDTSSYQKLHAHENGIARAQLEWHDDSDIDLHAHTPDNKHIYFANNKSTYFDGSTEIGRVELDHDNLGFTIDSEPNSRFENIIIEGDVPKGTYSFYAKSFSQNTDQTDARLVITNGLSIWIKDTTFTFSGQLSDTIDVDFQKVNPSTGVIGQHINYQEIDLDTKFKSKPVLAIHSNTHVNSGISEGHAWISYVDNNNIGHTYGLWPDWNSAVPDNGEGSDVRTDIELKSVHLYNRYYELNSEQTRKLEGFISTHATYGKLMTYTCASWASEAISKSVGEDVRADDILSFETPRQVSKSINALEEMQSTSILKPVRL